MNHSFDNRRPFAILLIGAILAPLTAYSMLSAAERGGFTPTCARLDLSASTIIEERGMIAGTPTPWLANAGLAHLQARMLCGAGEEEKAIILYRRIIGGDMSLAAAPVTQ
jgi:hypothetical protein